MKKQSYVFVVALAALFGALANQAFRNGNDESARIESDTARGLDKREIVSFNEEQAHFALTQMRGLLETLVVLDEAEEDQDFGTMAQAAALQGPGQTNEHPDGFHDTMPDGFREMSRQMRQGFGQAAQAAAEGDLDAYFKAKRQVQSTCIACHEAYRIPTAP